VSPATLRDRAEYLAVRAGAAELLKLPPAAAARVMEALGGLAFHVLRRRTRIGRENLRAAFPQKAPEEIEELLSEVYRNLFRLAGEIFYMRRLLRESNWRRFITVENGERALEVTVAGRGGILVSGHLGNWELLGQALPYIGLPPRSLARPLDNPLLERYILGLRQSGEQRIILKAGAGAEIERILEGGGFVSLLVDQDAGHKGAFVPFMGRLASTWRTPAILSQRTGAPILPGCCVREGRRLRFRVLVGRPIRPRAGADPGEETLRITGEFTAQLEEWVRAHPEQYLWLHRRWKSRPGERALVWAGCSA